MKKRLLALALCLVLAMSLLPLTAAADDITVESVEITAKDVILNTKGPFAGYYGVDITSLKLNGKEIDAMTEGYTISSVLYKPVSTENIILLDALPTEGEACLLRIIIQPSATSSFNCNNISSSLNITSNDYYVQAGIARGVQGRLEITHELKRHGGHNWDIRKPNSGTLTAKCLDSGCAFENVDMGVTLTAHSVTLPESPFHAEVQFVGAFQNAFPDAKIGELVYKYKGPGDSEYREIQPIAANARAGEYQVGVRVTGLPISAGAIAARGNQDNSGFADLYVQYTAVDPAITAQTGDNRPIELMLAGLVAFAALAAAAFIVDNKRKYSQ